MNFIPIKSMHSTTYTHNGTYIFFCTLNEIVQRSANSFDLTSQVTSFELKKVADRAFANKSLVDN